jgi:hypothetical protein
MGLSGGTYTWAWGSGGNASTLVMTIEGGSVTPTPTSTPTGTPASTPTGTPISETPTPTGTPAETPGATPGETPTPTGTPAETPGATPGETPTPTTTPTSSGVILNVTQFTAVSTLNVPEGDWTITTEVVLNGNVNQDTFLSATINALGGQQTFGITIPNGGNNGIEVSNSLVDPAPVSPDCLTFLSGDTRVSTFGYTCP